MKRKEDIEVIHGSGNVFRDLKRPDADVKQLKGILAAEIIKMLDRDKLTVRAAQTKTGIAAADFSRIRNANLARERTSRSMLGGCGRLREMTSTNSPEEAKKGAGGFPPAPRLLLYFET